MLFAGLFPCLLFGQENIRESYLVRDGKGVSAIVIGGPRDAQSKAIGSIVSNIEEMSGAKLPVLMEADLGDVKIEGGRMVVDSAKSQAEAFILLGYGELAKRMGYDGKAVESGRVIVETRGNTIGIFDVLQEGESAASRAAIVFLEKLGIRSLWPGVSGKVVPKKSTISVGALNVHYTPKIGQRIIRIQEGNRGFEQGLALLGITVEEAKSLRKQSFEGNHPYIDWAAWNGLGGNIGIRGGHAGYGLKGGWMEHGQSHPEWFALQPDGTRDMRGQERWIACVSNPGLVEYVANSIIQELNGKAAKAISLAPNDGGYVSPCMCEECKKLDPPDAPKVTLRMFAYAGDKGGASLEYPSLTDRHVHYWNAVAERVNKVVPDQKFIIDAYSYYSSGPVREKLNANLIVRYVPSTTDAWKGWQDAGAKMIFWRPNNLHVYWEFGVYKPVARKDAEKLKTFADADMVATDMQGIYHNWATHGLEYYINARFSWDPDQSYDAVLDDYCKSGFGAGANDVKEYFGIIEREVLLIDKNAGRMFPGISSETVGRLRDRLKAAEAATKDDPEAKRRVLFLRSGLEFSAISAEAYRLAEKAQKGEDVDLGAAKDLMDRRWKLMRNLFLKENLAVNTPLVAVGEESFLWRPLKWKPSQSTGTSLQDSSDNWLYDDQTEKAASAENTKQERDK